MSEITIDSIKIRPFPYGVFLRCAQSWQARIKMRQYEIGDHESGQKLGYDRKDRITKHTVHAETFEELIEKIKNTFLMQ
jgi:hypothetical protein